MRIDRTRARAATRRTLRAGASALFWVLGCSRSVEPLPTSAVSFTPPAQYALWWQMTEQCSGRAGTYQNVRWYTVPDDYLTADRGDTTIGDWYPGRNQIVLSQRGLRDPLLIRHEMLHALANATGHSREYFVERCNGYVSCVDACAREAGPIDSLPQPSALPIDRSQLVVSTRVVPSSVSDSSYDGWFAIIVSVTNPVDHFVRLRLATFPSAPDASPTLGWGFFGGGHTTSNGWVSYGYGYAWSDSAGFDAGETRTLVIDERAQTFSLVPATYQVRGWFNVDTAAASFVVK